jgi:hypothetical protein
MIFKSRSCITTTLLCLILGFNSPGVYAKDKVSSAFILVVDSLPGNVCSDSTAIRKIIDDAIELGAPIYNAGFHIGCYRIYEWAAYKIVYVYGNNCKEVEKILKAAIEKSHGDYSDTEKAWLMRIAFDKILGVPTKVGNPEKESNEKGSTLKEG